MKLKLQIIAFLFPLIAFGQKITISGNVSDTQDLLPGVSILEKGTSNGTSSDIDGNYSIKVNQNATLVFSFLGYKTQEISISDKKFIKVIVLERAPLSHICLLSHQQPSITKIIIMTPI